MHAIVHCQDVEHKQSKPQLAQRISQASVLATRQLRRHPLRMCGYGAAAMPIASEGLWLEAQEAN